VQSLRPSASNCIEADSRVIARWGLVVAAACLRRATPVPRWNPQRFQKQYLPPIKKEIDLGEIVLSGSIP